MRWCIDAVDAHVGPLYQADVPISSCECCLLMAHSRPFLQRTDLGLGMFINPSSPLPSSSVDMRQKDCPLSSTAHLTSFKAGSSLGIIQLQSPLWDQSKASLTFSTYIFSLSYFPSTENSPSKLLE